MAKKNTAAIAHLAFLQSIASASDAFIMATPAEANAAIVAGHAVADTSVTEGDKAKITLTDAGRAVVEANAKPADKPAKPSFELESGVAIPEGSRSRAPRESIYPFDSMEVNQSFHMSVPEGKSLADLKAQMSSSVSSANAKYSTDHPTETETVSVRNYQKGQDGKLLLDANGKRILLGTSQVTRPKRVAGRTFVVKAVEASDPKGVGVRVWRTA